MKVLHIIDSLGTGGAEKLVLDTVPLFVERGHTVDVILLNGDRTPFYKELEAMNCCRIISLGRSYYNPLYVLKIGKYLSKYDIVHVHLFPAQYFAALAKLLFSNATKLIFTEHNTTNTRLENVSFKLLERFIYSHYQRVICITSNVKAALMEKLSLPENKLIVIENGINYHEIKMAQPLDRNTFGYKEADVLLMMVAGFRKQKDQDTVIRALRYLPAHYHLILVGDGERRGELVNLVNTLKLAGRVQFLGIRSDVYSLVKMADIAILSSHWEGFGLAAAEAMAAGTPVIASNVPGLAEVVDGGGILFQKGNEHELSTQILNLSSDTVLQNRCSEMGMKKSECYDIGKLVTKSIQLYQGVLNN